MNLPEAFLSRMKERLGRNFPAFLASYELPPCRGLRVNPLKISAAEFASLAPFPLHGSIPWEENGFYLETERAGADPYHAAGLYYLQEPSAMAAVHAAKGIEKTYALDLCAAPGGKTAQLAAEMNGEGFLVANEIDLPRAKILSQNVERMGITNCAVTSASPESLSERFPAFFDFILADAPCSGEGMFKKEPNAIPEWSEGNVKRCAARQRDILDCAAEMLAAGGTLVYSTCTFAEEEDERQIASFLQRFPDFTLIEQKKLYPHTIKGEGHYFAVLKRSAPCCLPPASGEGTLTCPPPASGGGVGVGVRPYISFKPFPVRKNSAAESAFRAFERDFFEEPLHGALHTLSDGRMYLVPRGTPDLSGLYLLRLGVELGTWDGKLFKPAHALAMAFGGKAKRKLFLSREESVKYLRGETVSADMEDGWCAVCVEQYPLGLGKCVKGTVKNHLPKGLRI